MAVCEGPFVSASLLFKGAALEGGLSNRGRYLPDFTVYEGHAKSFACCIANFNLE